MSSCSEKNDGKVDVGIVIGSDSDLPIAEVAAGILKKLQIPYEIRILSAHRTPNEAAEYARNAEKRGIKVIIAMAGLAAALPGFISAHTNLPVIGVPIDSPPLNGLDSLLSIVQMPGGVPVATMGIGKHGAKNAALLAGRILSLLEPKVALQLEQYVREQKELVLQKDKNLQNK